MDRGAWRAMVHGVSKELDMTEPLSMQAFILRNGLGVTFLVLGCSFLKSDDCSEK